MERYICIHGHFYQPPRENPWLEEIELQDSAYPFHDWNERITAECYAPNTAARILDSEKRIIDIVNNYSKISFNFGPTLISWIEKHQPEVYQAILNADKLSMENFSGHGSAISQGYNHMIMPLASQRDKYTQVSWGIKDFQRRFSRVPEGMWLPETAVDIETLEVLADLGIKFTILAPRQAKRVRKLVRGSKWQEVKEGKFDPTEVYLCTLPSKRSINLFFYDAPTSQDTAFGGLLRDGESLAKRLLAAFTEYRDWPQIVHMATDGETFGHHHRFGDMALAYCLNFIESQNQAKLTNYGEFLEKHPPSFAAEIFENSSWSCIHGVERWRENCGCHSGMHPGWTQAWRKPLREAMDGLREKLIPLFEGEASKYLKDPWEARNDYIEVVLDRSRENVESFFVKHEVRVLSREEKVRSLKLLEMQRNAMLMFTSCGWFFDETSGVETIQVMQYAARAIQLAGEFSEKSVEKEYLQILEKASSNLPELENGAKIYELFVKPAMLDLLRVGGHFAISSLFEEYPESASIYCYTVNRKIYHKAEAGKLKLAIGKARILSNITWEEEPVNFAVLHLGDHNFNGGVQKDGGDEAFSAMHREIKETFEKSDLPEVIRLIDKDFGMNNYSLTHLFRDEQRKILTQVLRSTLEGIEVAFREIYEKNYPIMSFLQSIQIPLPTPLFVATEYIVNTDLKKIFEEKKLNLEKLESLIKETQRWPLKIDRGTLGFVANDRIGSLMETLSKRPEEICLLEKIENILKSLISLSVELDLWKTQNAFFSVEKKVCSLMKKRAETGEDFAKGWLGAFHRLGSLLNIKVHDDYSIV